MTCRDLDRLLASHSAAALSPDAQQHSAECPRCRILLHAIEPDDSLTPELRPALVSDIASRLASDLTAVRPLPPMSYLIAGFAITFLVMVGIGGAIMGHRALERMDWLTAAITFASLAVSAALLAFALATQMSPGSRQFAPPLVLTLAILLGLAVIFAALFPYHLERAFWLHTWLCLRAGLAAGALGSVLVWLILRRGAILDPRASGALAGLMGGLAGITILEIHCPNFNALHILIGHWGAALLFAGIGWIAGAIAARRESF
jgi:hypothetical protein